MTGAQRRDVLRAAVPLAAGLALGTVPGAAVYAADRLIRGAGATFPAPLYQKWVTQFEQAHPTLAIDYDAVGGGEGVSRLIAGSVDFAASDAAMTDEQIAKVQRGVRMIPATAGLISIIYNVPGLAAPLRLPRDVLAAIFMGEVTEWDDPAIVG